ncbi:MAG: hypothetical protein V4508_08925 [Pseudomonadota bacterium]
MLLGQLLAGAHIPLTLGNGMSHEVIVVNGAQSTQSRRIKIPAAFWKGGLWLG